jgi:hypothetical protein
LAEAPTRHGYNPAEESQPWRHTDVPRASLHWIIQTPSLIVILYEGNAGIRQIFLAPSASRA